MKVLRARLAGFCFGVSHALKLLDNEVLKGQGSSSDKGRLFTLGPIIHNPGVMARYASLGVGNVDSPHEVKARDRIVIRAHGIPRQDEKMLAATGAKIIDATCPKVKKAQLAIAEASAKGSILLLFGEPEHPEVRGLLSYALSGAHVFGNREEAAAIKLLPKASYFLAAQTTQDRSAFCDITNDFMARIPNGCDMPVLDTICNATRKRQEEVLALAEQVDLIVVVGGLNSGNTRRLAEVAEAAGTPAVHIEKAEALSDALATILKNLPAGHPLDQVIATGNWPKECTIGLTAGASTPQEDIDEAENILLRL